MLRQARAEAAREAEGAAEREAQLRVGHEAAEAALQQEAAELREQIAAWAEARAKRLADADELLKLRSAVRKLEGQLSAQAGPFALSLPSQPTPQVFRHLSREEDSD